MKVIFWSNGNVMCFDDNGEQVPELQKDGWFVTYLKRLEDSGIDPTKVEFETDTGRTFRPFRTENGWNWEVSKS